MDGWNLCNIITSIIAIKHLSIHTFTHRQVMKKTRKSPPKKPESHQATPCFNCWSGGFEFYFFFPALQDMWFD